MKPRGGHNSNNLQLLIQVYFSFGDFSQSITCITTRFGECSSILLDKLWYNYSYIYKPTTTTIQYGIYRFLNARHASPFQLLSSFKHATPSALTPLFNTSSFTTCNVLQLSILLESASASSFSITLSAFFVNFVQSTIYLYLANVDNEDNKFNSTTKPDLRYKSELLNASLFQLLAILKPTTSFISILLYTTNSILHLLAFLESTIPSFPPPLWLLFVIFFLYPVSTVTLLRLVLSYITTNFDQWSNNNQLLFTLYKILLRNNDNDNDIKIK